MNTPNHPILDNPVWHALQTVHKDLTLGTGTVRRYPSNILRIAGCNDPLIADLDDLIPFTSPREKLFIVGDLPDIPSNWTMYTKLDCIQMICPNPILPVPKDDAVITRLLDTDRDEMLEFINQVQPGYYFKETPLLGNYFGIKRGGKLVAMAGERLKITGYTEVSAVCTHPDYTGRGYAQQLVAHVAMMNFEAGTLPFLHFVATNTRARKVYELLGFKERRVIPFWGITLDSPPGPRSTAVERGSGSSTAMTG